MIQLNSEKTPAEHSNIINPNAAAQANVPPYPAGRSQSRRKGPAVTPGVSLSIGAFACRLVVSLVIIAIAAALWRMTDILVLLFGGILLAIGLSASARFIARHTAIPKVLALVGVIFIYLAGFAAAMWLFGSVVRVQIAQVVLAAPEGLRVFWEKVGADPYGRQIIDQARLMNLSDATSWVTSTATGAATTLTKSLGYFVIAIFVAIYLAAQPERYRRMCLRLVPPLYRKTAEHLFDVTGDILQRWLAGQVVVMATLGVLSGLGLWLLGIEAAFALGLVGGLLSFIPYLGAILAAVPATLVALTQGPNQAGSVLLMYLAVHFVEGNFVTPLVQAEATSLPPVLAILSTVAFTVLFGPIAVLLAAPLTLLFMAVVEVIYVQAGLGEPEETAVQPDQMQGQPLLARVPAPPSATKLPTTADTSADEGLTAEVAAAILQRDGPNELPSEGRRGPARLIFDALREPMLQLLLAAGAIYLVLGNRTEALILLGFALLNVGMVVYQESRTERALAALKDLTSPHALVIRARARQNIPASGVVAGDILILSEGDRVPADARLISATDLEADESLLTGESVPVRKTVGADSKADTRPGGETSGNVWSGSLVVRGSGLARVAATGPRTEIGRIGKSLASVESAPTSLQLQTRRLVKIFAVIGVGLSAVLALAYGYLHGDWLQGVLAGITLAMATLPEEFPLVLTIFMILGAWRMAQSNVLTRRSSAVEALGGVTVLCTDKTGTLTLNRMTVAELIADGERLTIAPRGETALPEAFHRLVEYSILASRPDPYDPMERAFIELGARFLKQTEHLHADWTLAYGFPLQPDLLAMSQVWRRKTGGGFVVAAKGAPEAVAELCHLPADKIETVRAEVSRLASEGLRVLAVADAEWAGEDRPGGQHEFDFRFVGLLGLSDPLRPEVPAAVEACIGGGIRVVMITGDHAATARAIAKQAGIASDDVVTGKELAALEDAAFAERIARTSIFARIMPEQKLRLVQAFAKSGEVVAMTGDGVNDAPSLKAAHIGVAMGGRGTDVAREAAALVLLDDNFASLATGIRLGRRIADNLRKAIGYILAVHVPIAGMSLIPVLFGWPLVLGPIHVVFLELIIDPVSSIVFEAEPEEPGLMSRPPRKADAPLFDAELLSHGVLQGAVVLAAALGVYYLGVGDAHGEEVSRCMAFVTLVLGNLGLVFTNRSSSSSALFVLARPNRALALVLAVTLSALAFALWVPWLRGLFGFAPLAWRHLAEAAGAALAATILNDVIGIAWRRLRPAMPEQALQVSATGPMNVRSVTPPNGRQS